MGDISLRGRGAVETSRIRKNLGGAARRDMTHGYYQPDMGMRGGQMYRGGGVVKKRGSMGVALRKGGKADKNWIQKAVNPKHKGYCTPMTKKTCTPKRKALARTFKKMGRERKRKG
jgi:hypothetical protein